MAAAIGERNVEFFLKTISTHFIQYTLKMHMKRVIIHLKAFKYIILFDTMLQNNIAMRRPYFQIPDVISIEI